MRRWNIAERDAGRVDDQAVRAMLERLDLQCHGVAGQSPVIGRRTLTRRVNLRSAKRATIARSTRYTGVIRASALRDPERRVDLVAEREAARVGVGLGGVEPVRHIRVADAVLEVDETE